MTLTPSAAKILGFIRLRLSQAKASKHIWIRLLIDDLARVACVSRRTAQRALNLLRDLGLFRFVSTNCNKAEGLGRQVLFAHLTTRIPIKNGESRGVRPSFEPSRKEQVPSDTVHKGSYSQSNQPERRLIESGEDDSSDRHRARGYQFARQWAKTSPMWQKIGQAPQIALINVLAAWWVSGGWREEIARCGEYAAWRVYQAESDGQRVSGALAHHIAGFCKPRLDIDRAVTKARESIDQALDFLRRLKF